MHPASWQLWPHCATINLRKELGEPRLKTRACSTHPRGVGPNAECLSEADLCHRMQVNAPHVIHSFASNGYAVIPDLLSPRDADKVACAIVGILGKNAGTRRLL